MKIEISKKEIKLHISALEANINYWMFESGCFEDYSVEICSAILLLEKLADENYRFSERVWVDGRIFTIQELKKEYISRLKEYMPPNESDYYYEEFKSALERDEKYLG